MMDLGADDLTNQNLYNHCHAEDLKALKKAHEDCKPYFFYKHLNQIAVILFLSH